MNVTQCPNCKKYDVKYGVLGPVAVHANTEIHLVAYCPDCGYSFTIVYSPDHVIERN